MDTNMAEIVPLGSQPVTVFKSFFCRCFDIISHTITLVPLNGLHCPFSMYMYTSDFKGLGILCKC